MQSAMYSQRSAALPVLSSTGIRYLDCLMSKSPFFSDRTISQTRRLVPPMSRARKVPCSLPVGKPMTQVTFIGWEDAKRAWGFFRQLDGRIEREGKGAHNIPTLDAE